WGRVGGLTSAITLPTRSAPPNANTSSGRRLSPRNSVSANVTAHHHARRRRPRSRVLVRRPRRGLVEHETHHDGVPQFSALAPVVAPTAALDLESEAPVESQGGAVVRPHLEGELVDAGPVASPLDRRVEQRRAHALASPAVAH